ncbi:mammalian cell entry protein [Mycobacterium sp. SMC-8]|uniref:mammalian cell entry protein n=1 Tax=Mycobacterium sp. SMC-8 TaxID=2857060 RepID=UPI0021B1AD54|nr:mammalian cell entry protein [Mycobacterium sp. SMC-8]UXA11539.1 mammalian cell entry protein [Mycobacterium sp. SMC-8]
MSVGGEHDEPLESAGHQRLVAGIGFTFLAAVILVAAATTGWFGYQALQSNTVHDRNQQFLDAGKTMAAHLTTIDAVSVDEDIRRVVESSTGDFRAEFEKSAAGFADVVRNAQAKSIGTVTAAGIESVDGRSAQILVTTSVQTTNAGTAEPQPRLWRMRVTIEKQGDVPMVSKVDFVS